MAVSTIYAAQGKESVYYIIVSDEGTSTKPRKHDSYKSAYDESIRLSKLKPGTNFTIFKSIGNTFTVKPVDPKTEHTVFQNDNDGRHYAFAYRDAYGSPYLHRYEYWS